VMSASAIISVGIAFATLGVHRNYALISRGQFFEFLFWAAVYTTFWVLLAVSLGISLWDFAAQPKFDSTGIHDALDEESDCAVELCPGVEHRIGHQETGRQCF
jgi:hypothetical protein